MATVTMYRGIHPDGEKGLLALMGDLVALSHDDGHDDVWESPTGSFGFEHPSYWVWSKVSDLEGDFFDKCSAVWTHDFEDVDFEELTIN